MWKTEYERAKDTLLRLEPDFRGTFHGSFGKTLGDMEKILGDIHESLKNTYSHLQSNMVRVATDYNKAFAGLERECNKAATNAVTDKDKDRNQALAAAFKDLTKTIEGILKASKRIHETLEETIKVTESTNRMN